MPLTVADFPDLSRVRDTYCVTLQENDYFRRPLQLSALFFYGHELTTLVRYGATIDVHRTYLRKLFFSCRPGYARWDAGGLGLRSELDAPVDGELMRRLLDLASDESYVVFGGFVRPFAEQDLCVLDDFVTASPQSRAWITQYRASRRAEAQQ